MSLYSKEVQDDVFSTLGRIAVSTTLNRTIIEKISAVSEQAETLGLTAAQVHSFWTLLSRRCGGLALAVLASLRQPDPATDLYASLVTAARRSLCLPVRLADVVLWQVPCFGLVPYD